MYSQLVLLITLPLHCHAILIAFPLEAAVVGFKSLSKSEKAKLLHPLNNVVVVVVPATVHSSVTTPLVAL